MPFNRQFLWRHAFFLYEVTTSESSVSPSVWNESWLAECLSLLYDNFLFQDQCVGIDWPSQRSNVAGQSIKRFQVVRAGQSIKQFMVEVQSIKQFLQVVQAERDRLIQYGWLYSFMGYSQRLKNFKICYINIFKDFSYILLIALASSYLHISFTGQKYLQTFAVIFIDFLRCANEGCECSFQDANGLFL